MNKNIIMYWLFFLSVPLICFYGINYLLNLQTVGEATGFTIIAIPLLGFVYIRIVLDLCPLDWVVKLVEGNRQSLEKFYSALFWTGMFVCFVCVNRRHHDGK